MGMDTRTERTVELWQAIGNLSPGVAVGALCLYFYNQITLKYLDERKEIIAALAAERREWVANLERITNRYDERLVAVTEVAANVQNQLHALRGKLTEFMLTRGDKPQGGSHD